MRIINRPLIAVRTRVACSRQRAVSLDIKLCSGLWDAVCFGDDEPALVIPCAVSCCCWSAVILRRFLIVPDDVWSLERTGATHDASEIGAS